MKHVSTFLIGLLFGLGLVVSGMSNPEKVLGFLDLFGEWDPSLAFVMGGAVVVTFFGFRLLRRDEARKPWFESKFRFPTATDIDTKLIGGSALFGVGWGLVGLCPGPALTAILVEPSALIVFSAGTLGGMMLPRLLDQQ